MERINDQRLRVSDHVAIFKRGKKGRYTAEITLSGGRRIRRALKTSNQKAAVERAMKAEAQLIAGTFQAAAPKRALLKPAVDDFMTFKKTDGRAHNTIVKYEAELELFIAWCHRHGVTYLDDLNARVHDRYRAERGKAISTITMHHMTIIHKTFTRWCVSRDLIAIDPLRKVKSKRPPRNTSFVPTLAQMRQILTEADGIEMPLFAMLAMAGLRIGEAANLRPKDVDLASGWTHVISREGNRTKTGLSRKVPIHPCLRFALSGVKPSKEHFFADPISLKRLDVRKPNRQLQAIAQRMGLPIGRADHGIVVHSLRHFFRTHCTNEGVPTYVIDEWMGHVGDHSTGKLYYHLSDDKSQKWMSQIDFGGDVAPDNHRQLTLF